MGALAGRFFLELRTFRELSPRGRMLRGIAANLYDKGAVTLVQVLTITVLTRAWGAEGYGLWLLLLTVPTYIALSDLGLGAAAGVTVTQSVARGEFDAALEAIHSTTAFVLCVVAGAAVLVLFYAGSLIWSGEAVVGGFSAVDVAIAVVLIVVYSIVLVQMNILTIVFRATHKFAFAMAFAGTLILIEGGALLCLAESGFDIVPAACAYLLIRCCGYIVFVRLLRTQEPWVTIGFRHATRRKIRELAKPSVAALALTFATALVLQGVVVGLGATAGATAVALFGAVRTISRVPLQLSGLVLRPSLPELTRALTERNVRLARRLMALNVAVAAGATIPFGLAIVFLGESLLGWLSGGELQAPAILLVLLSATATVNAIWTALAAPLMAMNRQQEFAFYYMAFALAAVVFSIAGAGEPVIAAASACLAAEMGTMIVVMGKAVSVYRGDRA